MNEIAAVFAVRIHQLKGCRYSCCCFRECREHIAQIKAELWKAFDHTKKVGA